MIGKSLGHYEIREPIGAGGMGQVYRARDTRLGRDVAVKLLPTAFRADKKALARLEREAKALAALNHPNIVTIYSIEKEKEDLFLTMELVEGQPLDAFIRDGGITVEAFGKIAVPLTAAVAAAHDHGVIHRDLKPANIIVTADGRVKVLDFGLALVSTEQPLTDTNVTVGTTAYMSPEQISGGDANGRSDIFSLGIMFYELLSGARPFRGTHPAAIMYSIVNEEASRLQAVPAEVADLVERCLKKTPEDRFADANALNAALETSTSAPAPAASDHSATVTADAHSAFDKGNWQAAYDALHAAAEQRELSPEEYEMLGECGIWLCRPDESTAGYEKAHAAFVKSGQNARAAGAALKLADQSLVRCASKVAGGWVKRAERLLENEPEAVQHGVLLRWRTVEARAAGDFERALSRNKECYDIADRHGDADLRAIALHDRGQILIARGDVEEGTALVDEAMTSAASGEVNQLTVGLLYCRTMSVCDSLADYARAREWSEAALRWCEPYSASAWPGVCRTHSATNLRHRGEWKEAEERVRSATKDLVASRDLAAAGEAFNELGMLTLCKGDYEEAEDAFRRAHELGCDPVPGLPLLRLAQGSPKAAQEIIERALGENDDHRLQRAKILAARVVIALANQAPARADAATEELFTIAEEFGCPAFKAHALMGRGAVLLERGETGSATLPLREAWSMFNEMGLPYDAARARVLLAKAYQQTGNKEDAKLQLEASYKTFSELGARPDLEAVSALIARLG